MFLIALAISGILAVSLYFILIVKAPKVNDPPSPGWVPILGSLLYLPKSFEQFFSEKFSKEPLIVMHMGLDRMYCLNTYEAVKEALIDQGDKFLLRAFSASRLLSSGDGGGIVSANGEHWREYRRFALKTLRDLGFGRQGSEVIISSEAEKLCEKIENSVDNQNKIGINTGDLFSPAISNVICQLVFGSRLADEENDFKRVLDLVRALLQKENDRRLNFTLMLLSKYFANFPIILKLLSSARAKQIETFRKITNFCQQQAQKHRDEWQESAEARDFIDAHLSYQRDHSRIFNDSRLAFSIVDLFVAGTDTTSHTLRWAVINMIANPHVAKRVYAEIQQVIGTDRMVTMKDKTQMHYTMATLEEVHRFASLASTAVPHMTSEPATVNGHTIPANTVVIYNIYSIHNSEKYFPEPKKFNPERFLDSEGKFKSCEQVIPFGVGKRACLGESLARMELFIFFVTLVQRYEFRLGSGETRNIEEILMKAEEGSGLRAPKEHCVVFERRS